MKTYMNIEQTLLWLINQISTINIPTVLASVAISLLFEQIIHWIKQRNLQCQQQEKATPHMSLEQFVAESCVQISNGIRIAQDKITRLPLTKDDEKYFPPYINPTPIGGREHEIHMIAFDIATTVSSAISFTNGSQAKSEIIIATGKFELSQENKRVKDNTTSSITRIQFSIPVIYPSMPLPHPGNEK